MRKRQNKLKLLQNNNTWIVRFSNTPPPAITIRKITIKQIKRKKKFRKKKKRRKRESRIIREGRFPDPLQARTNGGVEAGEVRQTAAVARAHHPGRHVDPVVVVHDGGAGVSLYGKGGGGKVEKKVFLYWKV